MLQDSISYTRTYEAFGLGLNALKTIVAGLYTIQYIRTLLYRASEFGNV